MISNQQRMLLAETNVKKNGVVGTEQIALDTRRNAIVNGGEIAIIH